MPLVLERVVRGRCPLDADLGRVDLERLLCVGRQHELSADVERAADVLVRDLVVVRDNARLKHYLKVREVRPVIQLDKAERV